MPQLVGGRTEWPGGIIYRRSKTAGFKNYCAASG